MTKEQIDALKNASQALENDPWLAGSTLWQQSSLWDFDLSLRDLDAWLAEMD